ncbi:alpha/beta fold hydrolase [Sphingomonas japonica]|uniref:Pimeloyl-ACP methyl ester carboxylesterase n=1 Tax=Sphingomonas japonica TaxID=511662 RepID=A0ABX0U2Y7_9SPHN|nr:alpha/beta hydrolase [Sphingomonas japonica]NIJ23682.1 pimeloyl-ACP methyl ester carboxylesterase [Sphingomonas japonica]
MIRLALSISMALAAVPAAAQTTPSAEGTRTALAPVASQTDHLTIMTTMGEGPPVLLIPGLASPRTVWNGVRTDLARNHQVILPEVRGFAGGDPGGNVEPGMLDGIVADLAEYLRKRGGEKVAVIGHSMGGLIGMMLAARHPELVDRLMVVDALPFFGALFDPNATAASVESQARAMQAQIAQGPDAKASTAVTSDPGGIWSNTPAGRIQVANWSRMADPKVVAQAMYEDMVTDLRPDLGRITAKPFTVLYATGAGPMATAIWEREYNGSPATLVAVPDSYHFIMLDQPERFAREVATFLAD